MGQLKCATTWQEARLPIHQAGTALCHCQEALQFKERTKAQRKFGSCVQDNCSTGDQHGIAQQAHAVLFTSFGKAVGF